jgi:SAM-dependent methyltransferase
MENLYNLVPYEGLPFRQAHINRISAMGRIYGLNPPDVSKCRVLEVGCGDGSHLIPMAFEFPDSQFVGIDLAERPIARAVEVAAELGLDNASFRVADVTNLAGQPGECDYFIAHGLYSWVPQPVQEKILELCGRVIAENGIAYISYNAYPAWHVREMTRNIVRMHTAGLTDPVEIRARALSLLNAIYQSENSREPYRETIRAEMERIAAKEPYLCFHDDFSEHNNPVYFSEFVRRAATQGLQYLSEAQLPDLHNPDFSPETLESVNRIADPIEREQYYDFLTLRGFRRTLLCHANVTVEREISVERLKGLHYSSPMKAADGEPDLATFAPSRFQAQTGASITVNQPFVKAVLLELVRVWPGRTTWTRLLERARAVAPLVTIEDAEGMLREVLLRLHGPDLLELSTVSYPYSLVPSERPLSSPVARLQIRNGPRVTSLRHVPVDLDDELARRILPVLDGMHTREDLAAFASASPEEIDAALRRMADLSLLVS